MTQSMTAFARVSQPFAEHSLCWEIRSVNHRYLDISFRMPEAWRFLENDLRALVREKLARGKIECLLKSPDKLTTPQTIKINETLIAALVSAGNKLASEQQLQNDLCVSTLLNWPDVIQIVQPDMEQFSEQVLSLFNQTLTQLQIARETEGNELKRHICNRLLSLQTEIKKAQALVIESTPQIRDKLTTRLENLQIDMDKARIEQEIALILTKMDVSEELDRLALHVQEVGKTLKNVEAVGRRLDFLMQELNREANTLSSKSDSVALTQSAVEMKVLIEQMREQIQNIE